MSLFTRLKPTANANPATLWILVPLGNVVVGRMTGSLTMLLALAFLNAAHADSTIPSFESQGQSGRVIFDTVQSDVNANTSAGELQKQFIIALSNKLFKAAQEAEEAQDERSDKDALYQRMGVLAKKLRNSEQAFEDAVKTSKDVQAGLMRVSNEVDAEALAAAQAAVAQLDFAQADAIFEQIAARSELALQQTASAELGRAQIAEEQVRWQDAYAHAKRAYDLGQEVEALDIYARMALRLGRNEDGVRLYFQLISTVMDENGTESVEYATVINNLALLYEAEGRYEDAETMYKIAAEIWRAALGEGHPDFATSLNNLAELYRVQGRYEDAEPLYKQVIDIRRVALGEEHPNFLQSLENLRVVYLMQGRYQELLSLQIGLGK